MVLLFVKLFIFLDNRYKKRSKKEQRAQFFPEVFTYTAQ